MNRNFFFRQIFSLFFGRQLSGGEEEARIILGDGRYDELVRQEAEKQAEDKTIRSSK